MKWHLHDLGFLPLADPLARLSAADFRAVERLASDLPELVHQRTFRRASQDYLAARINWDAVLNACADQEVERLFMLFSYFASAYIHSPGLSTVDRLPSSLATPLVRLAQFLERPPILAYGSYCLHNWQRIDPNGPVVLNNLRLLQNFSPPGDGKEDEDWFILVHVDIEARAGKVLQAVSRISTILSQEDPSGTETLLETVADGLRQMNHTLARMPEGCRPEVYFQKVRPYIFGFTDVIYEDCFAEAPQTYRGETGAQSSIIPTLLMALGIRHKSSLLTGHLEDLRNYMPRPHRDFIQRQLSVRDYVLRVGSSDNPRAEALREVYNDCIKEVLAFRSKHFEYAVNYIESKVDNPIATGGTPYIPWLRQLIEETKEHYLA